MSSRFFRPWTIAFACLTTCAAWAHLDTMMQIETPPPLVKEVEAEKCTDVPAAAIMADAEALGGQAVRAGIQQPIFKVDFGELSRGMYVVYVIGKVTDDQAWDGVWLKPLNMGMRLQTPSGTQTWGVRASFNKEYNDVARIYFHAPVKGHYAAEVFIDRGSVVLPVLIDRIQLRDVLPGFAFRAMKTQRVLYTDEELAQMRLAAGRENKMPKPLARPPLSAEQQAARDEVMWNNVMPINATPENDVHVVLSGVPAPAQEKLLARFREATGKADMGKWEPLVPKAGYDQPWKLVNKTLNLEYTLADYNANKPLPAPWPTGEDKGGFYLDKDVWGIEKSLYAGVLPGAMNQRFNTVLKAISGGYTSRDSLVARYLLLGDGEAAADAAFLLAAFAYNYAGYDYQAFVTTNALKTGKRYECSNMLGRGTGYEGWSTPAMINVVQTYDALFPFIQGNSELARRVGRFVPWVKSPEDVIALIDTYFVQRMAEDGVTHVLYAAATPWAAAVLGPNDVSKKYLDLYFSRMYLRNTLEGFPDSITNGYSPDGLNYIGSSYYAPGESVGELGDVVNMLARYVRAGGDPKYNLADPKRFPRIAALPGSILDIYVAGGFSSNLGDVAAPDNPRRLNPDPKEFATLYRDAWLQQRDPRFAWLLANRIGQGDLTDAQWQQVQEVAAKTRDPILHQEPRLLTGFGLAVMEEGGESPDPRFKRTATVRTGVGSGHAHPDSLDLQFYAHGLRMLSDLGGRVMGTYGRPSCMSTYVHNVVEVDEESFTSGVQSGTGTAWVEAFMPLPGAQFTLASARAEGQPQVTLYQRGAALINVDDGGNGLSPNAYIFDVFRVNGGRIHTWCFKGVMPDEFTVNNPLSPAESETARKYLARFRAGSQREGTAGDVLEATWRLRRAEEKVKIGEKEITLVNYEQRMMGKDYDPASPRKFTRVTLFNHGGNAVLVGNWYATEARTREFDWPFLYVRQQTDRSVWPAIIQAYAGEPYIASSALLRTDAGVAVEVKTVNGFTDTLFQGGRSRVAELAGGRTLSGDFSMIRQDANGLVLAHVVGGAVASDGRTTLQTAKPALEGKILAADYDRMQFTVSGRWPVATLAGQYLTIRNNAHATNCRVTRAESIGDDTRITFARSAEIYQGPVEYFTDDGKAGLGLEPELFNYHNAYYNGMTAVNEAGQVLGHATLTKGDRYMYLGWPEWRRHLLKMTNADVTDANGDGKRTLKMIAAVPTKYEKEEGVYATKEPGEALLDLEVTRIREDGFMFWYKQHPYVYLDALKMPHPGWPYMDQTLKNEAGTKTWVSTLPGDTYCLSVEGRKLSSADLPDTDKNGQARVRLFDFGPGDAVSLPASLYLRRTAANAYEVRANVPLTVTLPGKELDASADGQAWKNLEVTRAGQTVSAAITVETLGSGRLHLRVR